LIAIHKTIDLVLIINLVLIDPQSVGKRTHDLIDTVNAKKRWKTICWRVNKYLKYNHLLPRFGKEQFVYKFVYILYINDINDISFLETPVIIVVL
jgi:hypothetical protein